MSKGGLIIRLIDVVLILLLGFIGISDFTIKTQIKLPQGVEDSNASIRKTQLIYIKADKNGKFAIADGTSKILGITNIYKVEQEVARLYNINKNIIIIIEPDLDSIIQTTVDLVDICEKYQIPKSISYEL